MMDIDANLLSPLRDTLPFDGGKPPWEAIAFLHAVGVGTDAQKVAVRSGNRVQVVALCNTGLVSVTAESAHADWYRSPGDVPDDFKIVAACYPLARVRGVRLDQLDHQWMQFGHLTKLFGVWVIDVDGAPDPIELPVSSGDGATDPTPFVQHLIQSLRS